MTVDCGSKEVTELIELFFFFEEAKMEEDFTKAVFEAFWLRELDFVADPDTALMLEDFELELEPMLA
jgi:hypothetical protein